MWIGSVLVLLGGVGAAAPGGSWNEEVCVGDCPAMGSVGFSFDEATAGASACPCPASEALTAWQRLKFGLFVHWGAYSQIGVDASWPLNWATRCSFTPGQKGTGNGSNVDLCAPKKCEDCVEADMTSFRKMYWGLASTFAPTRFDPTSWAAAAKRAGIKYFVMTTKHCDGFAMYNTSLSASPGTRQPLYGAAAEGCPARRDLFGEAAAAMRSEGLRVGAYYSKADWHSHDFWDPALGFAATRNANYDRSRTAAFEAKWLNFTRFVQGQLRELQDRYRPDIFWLDAGWVGAKGSNQSVGIADVARELRDGDPRVLVVNRVGGVAEDYLTEPENPPLDASLDAAVAANWPRPFEICVTLGTQWAYKPQDTYKTAHQVLQALAKVVAAGGSLLLDVGPDPTGDLPPEAYDRLRTVGDWMDANAEAIHDTSPQSPYRFAVARGDATQDWRLTTNRNTGAVYAMLLVPEHAPALPRDLSLPPVVDAAGGFDGSWPREPLGSVALLRPGGAIPVTFSFSAAAGLALHLPEGTKPPAPSVVVFKLQYRRDDAA